MRLGTIFFLFIALTTVWLSMAGTLRERHFNVDSKLRSDVSQLWGSSHVQRTASLSNGSRIDSADIRANLELEYRQKGHYWYSTYKVDFHATYHLPQALPADVALAFPLPAGSGLFNDFQILIDEKPVEDYQQSSDVIQISLPKKASQVQVMYVGRGSDQWWYHFESELGAPRNLRVLVTTNFQDIDFIDGSVSPDERQSQDEGWSMEWTYQNLLTGSKIGIEMPRRPDPGPALIDICQFAPLGLMLFFGSLAVCAVAEGRCPHPMHFLLLGTGFFSFHLLLIYLGDAIGVSAAFLVASAVAVFLNYSYTRQVLGDDFALGRQLPASILYLVLFSASFLVESYRGLLLVLLMVFSLYLLMRIAAKVDWHALELRNSTSEAMTAL